MSTSPEQTLDVCAAARAASVAAEQARKRKHVAAQKRFVKRLVGPERFDQCTYDEGRDVWTICGQVLQCFTRMKVCDVTPVPCLAYWRWDGRQCQWQTIYTLAQLGDFLREREQADAADRARAQAAARYDREHPTRSWWERLFS